MPRTVNAKYILPPDSGTKICRKCETEKPISEFNTQRRNKDGLSSYCKGCVSGYCKDFYAQNKDRILSRTNIYDSTETGRVNRRKREALYRETHHDKYSARTVVRNALQAGKLKKQPCEVCGDPNSQAHHDDYSKPLDVRWLCAHDHREFHKSTTTKSGGE